MFMRIGFDAKRAFYNFTGLGNFARSLVRDLSTYQGQNDYFLFTPKVHPNEEVNQFLQAIDAEIVSPLHPFHRTWRSFGASISAKKRKIDIFHGLSHELPRGLQLRGIGSVVTMHDIIYRLYPKYYTNTDRAIYHQKSSYACKTADRIIAISESTKKDVVEEYRIPPEKIEVIYQSCGVQYRTFFDHFKEDFDFRKRYKLPKQYMLYVGSVIERKKLLETVQAVQKQYRETGIPLVVIGSGKQYMRRVYSYVVENELQDLIYFRPDINYLDLPYIYYGAEMLIYPSEYEGFGIPVIESQYCATPVITSRMSSLPEVGGDHAFYLDEITSVEIERIIRKVLETSYTKDERRSMYHKHLEKFDPERICSQHQALYESI
jgi:glycosyltransferase involved in cell wall biosynthesis